MQLLHKMRFAIVAILSIVLFVADIFTGAVHIPAAEVWSALTGGQCGSAVEFVVMNSRLPQAITAVFGGAALATAGLMMQTMFRNPLAGPSVLGITAGANLGVALVMLLSGGVIAAGTTMLSGYVAVILGAFAGSVAILLLLIALASVVRNDLMLIIAGVMIGYLTSSVIMILNYSATTQGVHSYMMWGMGTFGGVGTERLPVFISLCSVGLVMAMLLVKPLNAMLLGDNYARNLGVDPARLRRWLLAATGLLTAVATAFCGPVAFIGLAVPHIARLILGTDNHLRLMPMTMLCGAMTALLCVFLCTLPTESVLPVNAVTPIVGIPVILYIILRKRT